MNRALAALALTLVACAPLRLGRPPRQIVVTSPDGRAVLGLAAAPPQAPQCPGLSRDSLGWTVGGAVSGALGSGASGIAGVVSTNAKLEWSLLGTSAGLSLFSSISGVVATWYGAQYTKACQ